MKNKIFIAFMLLTIICNVLLGIYYFATGMWSSAAMHICFGIIIAQVYFDSKNNFK